MSDEQLERIAGVLDGIDPNLTSQFINAKDKYKWLRDNSQLLEGYSDYTDNFKNIEDFIGDRNTRLMNFYKDQKGNKPSEARMQSFLEKNSDISDKDVNEWFDKTNYWKNYYEEEGKKEAGINRRKKEVKEWNLMRKLLASDYEQQRYINEPEKALFGDEAPSIGEAPETRWGAIGDLGTGAIAGVADVATAPLPIVNTVAGPTIRFGRDVAHKVSDSPYQKDWSDVVKDYGTDVAFNAGTQTLANTRKLSRMTSGLSKPEVKQAFETSLQTDAINKGLKSLSAPNNSIDFARQIKQLPESPLKQDLMTTIEDFANTGVDVKKANKIIHDYNNVLIGGWQDLYGQTATNTINGQMPRVSGNNRSYLNDILLQPKLTGYNKVNYGVLRGLNALNVGTPGTIAFESYNTVTGRGSKPTNQPDSEFESKKEALKQLHAQDWLNFGRAFAPKKKPGDPAYEAYVEVTGDTLD